MELAGKGDVGCHWQPGKSGKERCANRSMSYRITRRRRRLMVREAAMPQVEALNAIIDDGIE
jgi:hypothetical protein